MYHVYALENFDSWPVCYHELSAVRFTDDKNTVLYEI